MIGDENVAIVCRVVCKPRATLIFWQIVDDEEVVDSTTRLTDGEHNQLYWATISVCCTPS